MLNRTPYKRGDEIMGAIPPTPDYYAVLGVAHNASETEITRAWRQLVLLHHPDKAPSRTPSPGSFVDIRLINEARAVLSDPVRRAEFDAVFAALTLQISPNGPASAASTGPRVREYISLSSFTPHAEDKDSEPERYTLLCRCGHEYVIMRDDLENGVEVVGCSGCGEWIGVEYEVIEEENESDLE